MAAALRVKWRLRRQQRAGADEVDLDALWVEELAKGMSAS
jgi:hypothetical protein